MAKGSSKWSNNWRSKYWSSDKEKNNKNVFPYFKYRTKECCRDKSRWELNQGNGWGVRSDWKESELGVGTKA